MKNLRSLKSLTMLVVLVPAAVLFAAHPMQASGVCPAPGTGLPGAFNMLHDAGMMSVPLSPQGDAGMWIALINTYCG